MKTVLALTALGLLSFVVFACQDACSPPPAAAQEVRVVPPVEVKEEPTVLEKSVLQENLRKHLGGERIRPAEAKVVIIPAPDYSLYSRAGPFRQVQVMKRKAADVAKGD